MSRKWYHNKKPSSPKFKKKSQELSSSCRGWGIMLWWRVSWWMELTWTGWSWEKKNNTPSIKETQYQCYRWTLKWSCICCWVAPSHSETAMQRLWSRRSWQDSTRRCLEWGGEAISENAKDLITPLLVVDPSGKGGSVQNEAGESGGKGGEMNRGGEMDQCLQRGNVWINKTSPKYLLSRGKNHNTVAVGGHPNST